VVGSLAIASPGVPIDLDFLAATFSATTPGIIGHIHDLIGE